jgi:hypothetical protein
MLWRYLQAALLACGFAIVAAVPGQAGDGCCAPAPCAPAFRTVCSTEWVPETYTCTRTSYHTEYHQETYTAYRCEAVPEVRTRTYTVCHLVPETHTEVRNVCVSVPCVEQRTIMQPHWVCVPVTHFVCKTEDHGHYECCEVPCKPSLCDRLHKLCHRNECCCEEECVKTKIVKRWVPCPVTIQIPVTKMERHCEYHPVTISVPTCRQEVHQESFQVCSYQSVPEVRTENYTVMVTHTVPYQTTRTVATCVPCQVPVTLTRLVPHTVAHQVPVCGGCY